MKNIINGVIETINPKGGNGLNETIVIVLITITVCLMMLLQIEIPPFFKEIFIGIAFWLFGRNSNPKKEGKNNE